LLYFIIRSKYLEFSIIANTFTIRNNETYYEFDIYFNFSKSLLQQDEEILRKLVEFLENNQ
jgi:hypothetical protein